MGEDTTSSASTKSDSITTTKRIQIKDAEKNVFLWLSVSSIIISACIVAAQFLVREGLFNQEVIDEKATTYKKLEQNIENARLLKQNIDKLIADRGLAVVRQQVSDGTDGTTSNLAAIFDALPVKGDATAFANSLQTTVFPLSGVGVMELNTSNEAVAEGTESADLSGPQELPFKASISGNYTSIEKALVDMNRVIRPIKITELTIRSTDNSQMVVDIAGSTYYLPSTSVNVRTEKREQ